MPVAAPSLVAPIEQVRVAAFRIPTDSPESDGTLAWDATSLVVVEISAAGETGLGYTYGDPAIARLIDDLLVPLLQDRDAFAVSRLWSDMFSRLRNLGRQGLTAMAVSAIDTALWDLKAKCLRLPLARLFGQVRECMPVYGSGGFTSYSDEQLREQFLAWGDRGITRFKMKVGRDPAHDRHRLKIARDAIDGDAALFVDANSAYTRNQALEWAHVFVREAGVSWLEQPLPPGDLSGLAWLRQRVPPSLRVTDGEYGYDLDYFRRLIAADAVDVVMADVTRCGGFTGFLAVSTLCEAATLPLSAHCAPALHLHAACAARALVHAEFFHDHERIEQLLFDGAAPPLNGALWPDLQRPGHGLAFRWADAARYAA